MTGPAPNAPVRFRALFLGMALALALCAVTPVNNVYREATPLSGGHFPLAPFFILLWLTLGSWAFCRVFRRVLFTGRELLVVFTLMILASGIAYTAYRLFLDLQGGIFERFHSMPIARSAALWGHVLTSLVSNAISVVVIILVALIMGFRSSAGVLSWLAVAGILALFTLALTWIAAIAGLSAKSVDGAGAFSYPIIFLPFISSAFVPTASMSGPVRAFAENQPVTSIVDAIRALLSGQPVGNDIWVALAWCLGILIIAYLFAMRAYKRKAA